ncbi:hypothetical protein LINPERHAP1_LOCUS28743 [Linum perenne]
MLAGAKLAIRDGKNTPFWTGCWVDTDLMLIDLADSSRGIDNPYTVAIKSKRWLKSISNALELESRFLAVIGMKKQR